MDILLDMDEVLCDFISGAREAHGISEWLWDEYKKLGEWDMSPTMERCFKAQYTHPTQIPVTHNSFWKPIRKQGVEFWTSLRRHDWLEQLLTVVNQYDKNWFVVSTPDTAEASTIGKQRWLAAKFGGGFDRYFLTPHKYKLARPGAVLIDDKEQNCEDFRRSGGRAILFPSQGNRLYAHRHLPVRIVEEELALIAEQLKKGV